MAKQTKRQSKIDRDLSRWVNSLTCEQMCRLYEVIDGPLDPKIAAMSDDELDRELGI